MAQDSKIEWCKHTGNIWWGCTEVHAGCDNCYARVLAHRWKQELWGNDVPRRVIQSFFTDMDKYQKLAAADGVVERVFVGSMMDIFEKPMRTINNKGETLMTDTGYLRDIFFKHISDGRYPNLQFLLLTKRPSNINKYIPEQWKENPPVNVMFGTSPVNQETANKLIPQLLQVNGKKFLSIEPMLDEIDLNSDLGGTLWIGGQRGCDGMHHGNGTAECPHELHHHHDNRCRSGIDWIICGGESGQHKRPFNADWARKIRNQCAEAGVPFFMKQMDKIQPIPDDLIIREFAA